MSEPIPFPGGLTAPERGERISSADLDWTEFHRVNDVVALDNLRAWAFLALETAGAKCTGSGMGFGELDVDIELQGHRYSVIFRPMKGR